MQSLHDDDDWRVRAVLAAFQRVLKPVDHVLPHHVAAGFVWLMRVVNDDSAPPPWPVFSSAKSRDRSACTGCIHDAASRGAPVMFGATVTAKLYASEYLLILGMLRQVAYLPTVVGGQLRRVAGQNVFTVRRVPQCPRNEVIDKLRLGVARRDVDNQPLALAIEYPHQGIADNLMVPRLLPVKLLSLEEHPARKCVEVTLCLPAR